MRYLERVGAKFSDFAEYLQGFYSFSPHLLGYVRSDQYHQAIKTGHFRGPALLSKIQHHFAFCT